MAERRLAGRPASPGIARGVIVRPLPSRAPTPPSSTVASDQPGLLANALDAARQQLEQLAQRARSVAPADGSDDAAAIIELQIALLDDPALAGAARDVVARGSSAQDAWSAAVRDQVTALRSLADELLRERAIDVEDVGARVLALLTGRGPERIAVPAGAPGILAATDVTPSQVASLDARSVVGVATVAGSPLAHAAILAAARGLPLVVGLGPALLELEEGAPALLDGEAGTLTVWPVGAGKTERNRLAAPRRDAERNRRAAPRRDAQRNRRAAPRRDAEPDAQETGQPAITSDGVRVPVGANCGAAADVALAVREGADAIGLVRTELAFVGHAAEPGEEEQLQLYAAILAAAGERPVVFRTLDAGADKPLAFMGVEGGDGQALGLRGIRLALAHPQVLLRQLRALLRAGAGHDDACVLFPMISDAHELAAARRLLDEARQSIMATPAELGGRIRVGAMIETPAGALLSEQIAAQVDLLSIGTNDLTQYALAADRTDEAVAQLADGCHPAVLRLIATTVAGARVHGRSVSVCGQLACDPVGVRLLLGLGVDALSVPPRSIGPVKRLIRLLARDQLAMLASAALECASATEVRELVSRGAG